MPRADVTELRPFDASLPMALLRARETAMRVFRPHLAEHDLTEQQWRVLRALTASATPLEVGRLADDTFLLGPSLSRILAHLAERRLIERKTVAHDQRRTSIALTAAGRRLVRRIAPESELIYRRIEGRFGEERLARLLAELRAFAQTDLDAPTDAVGPTREEP